MLSNVFVPLLSQQAGADKRSAMMPVSDDRGQFSLLNEFLADLNKFVGQVGQTMHELQGNSLMFESSRYKSCLQVTVCSGATPRI